MQHARPKHTVAAGIAFACLTLLQAVASAQSSVQSPDAVSACRRVPERAERLACYDRAFPPVVESVTAGDPLPPPEDRVAPAATPAPRQAATARIVEVEMPSIDTTVFRAADGRVFVRERARTVLQWPAPPFDVQIETNRFGTSTYLRFPSGLRIRVANPN